MFSITKTRVTWKKYSKKNAQTVTAGDGWTATWHKPARIAADRAKSMNKKVYASGRLKDYRVKCGYTQSEMRDVISIASQRDISLSTYQKWENGKLALTTDSVILLSRVTKIPGRELTVKKWQMSRKIWPACCLRYWMMPRLSEAKSMTCWCKS